MTAIDRDDWSQEDGNVYFGCPKCGTLLTVASKLVDVKGMLTCGTICKSRMCDWRGFPKFTGLKKRATDV